MDAYTPYPVEGLAEELGLRSTRVPFVVLMAAIIGAAAGFFMQYWSMAVNYPFNAGGRPLEFVVHSPNLSDAFIALTGHALRDPII